MIKQLKIINNQRYLIMASSPLGVLWMMSYLEHHGEPLSLRYLNRKDRAFVQEHLDDHTVLPLFDNDGRPWFVTKLPGERYEDVGVMNFDPYILGRVSVYALYNWLSENVDTNDIDRLITPIDGYDQVHVIVYVEGGVVQYIFAPEWINVSVADLDTQEEERYQTAVNCPVCHRLTIDAAHVADYGMCPDCYLRENNG